MKSRMYASIHISLICCLVSNSVSSLNWAPKNNFSPGSRYGAFGFTIGQKGYVGSGVMQNGPTITLVNDFWEYDKNLDLWTQKASLPSGGRSSAATFSVLNKGYVTTGSNLVNMLNETWQFDPALNSWQMMADFPGDARYTCASFDVSDYGFVGMGYSNVVYSDFYRYNPVSDTWTTIAPIPGSPRQSAKGFSITDYGYVVGGADGSSGYNSYELWRYDPIGDVWIQKSDYPGNGSHGLAAFVVNSEGYVGSGTSLPVGPNMVFSDFYNYNPITDTWNPIQNFGGGIRQGAVSLTIGNRGFVGLGSTEIFPLINYQSDWWTFDDPTGILEIENSNEVASVYFNINQVLCIQLTNPLTEQTHIIIYDAAGRKLRTEELNLHQKEIEIKNLNVVPGMYFYKMTVTSGKSISGKVMFLD